MKEIYETISRSDLLRFGKVHESNIAKKSSSDLIELAEEIAEITSAKNFERAQSIFAHSASISLGGGREDCSAFSCRRDRVRELAQFAVLYSDRVYIKSFLSDHIPHPGGINWPNETELRRAFTEDLKILLELRPLVERDIVVPFTPPLNYCAHCLTQHSLGHDANLRLKNIRAELLQEFFDEVSLKLCKIGDSYGLEVEGPETLIEHGRRGHILWELPKIFASKPRIMARVNAGEKVPISKTTRRKFKYHYNLANTVFENLAFELTSCQSFNTSFLTNKPLHIDLLTKLSESSTIERRNLIARDYLTSIVPFITDVPLKDLVKLREQEAEAFVLYRQALNEAIDEYKVQGNSFTKRDAQVLYSDVIMPKLTILDSKIKSAQRNLVKETSRSIIGWAGAISFGLYAGFVPPDLVVAAKLLGLTKITADLISSTLRQADIKESIRNDEMYFLWRVQRKAKRTR